MEMVELYRRRARRTLADLEAEDYSEDTGFGELMGLATNRLISSGEGVEVRIGTGGGKVDRPTTRGERDVRRGGSEV